MKVTINRVDNTEYASHFIDFAEKHDLELLIIERPKKYWGGSDAYRYYAYFSQTDIKDGCGLLGEHGNGKTELEAVQNYADKILGKELVFRVYSSDRKNIAAPTRWLSVAVPGLDAGD